MGLLRRLFSSFRGEGMTTAVAGSSAPLFTLQEMGGGKVSLGDALKKGPVVLAFFKASCPVCQFTFPFIERLHKAYGSERVTIWGISQDDARDSKEYNQEYGITFPTLIDGDGYPVSNQYGLINVPTVLLVQPDGKVRFSDSGFSKKELEDISSELARHTGKPVASVFRAGEAIPDYKPG